MKTYTVAQIAKKLSVDEETVRRWIRSGKIKSNMASKKKGYLITHDELSSFVIKYPKYHKESIEFENDPYLEGLSKLLDNLMAERARLDEKINIIEELLRKA